VRAEGRKKGAILKEDHNAEFVRMKCKMDAIKEL
jgi:hypothetical protein